MNKWRHSLRYIECLWLQITLRIQLLGSLFYCVFCVLAFSLVCFFRVFMFCYFLILLCISGVSVGLWSRFSVCLSVFLLSLSLSHPYSLSLFLLSPLSLLLPPHSSPSLFLNLNDLTDLPHKIWSSANDVVQMTNKQKLMCSFALFKYGINNIIIVIAVGHEWMIPYS